MFILVVGAGRVGSAVAKSGLANGHEVSVLDEDPLSHERLDFDLDRTWEDAGGLFTAGTGIEIDALLEAVVRRADVFITSADGANTNLSHDLLAHRLLDIAHAAALLMDPPPIERYAR